MKKFFYNILPLFSIGLMLIIWTIISSAINNEMILPSISETIKEIINLFQDSEFLVSLLGTLLRSLVSFTVSFLIAFLFSYISHRNIFFKKFISPFIAVIRAMPTIAVVLLILFWVNSLVAPMIVTSLVIMPILYNNFNNSFNLIDKEQLEFCKIDSIKESAVLFKIEIPEMLPEMLNSIGTGLSLNLKLMVASEVLSQTAKSIGYMLNTSKAYFEISTMIALVLICIIVSVIIESIFRFFAKRSASWR